MEARIITEQEPVRVVGYGAEVDKEHAAATIGGLWERAGAAGLLGGDDTTGEGSAVVAHAVYHAYEDRLANRYRVVVGRASSREPGHDEEVVVIPAGDYACLEAEGGGADAAASLWRQAWTRWPERHRRTFEFDLERHHLGADGMRVELYLGVDGGSPPLAGSE